MLEIMKYILLLSLNLLKELTFKDQSNRHFYYVLIGEVLVSILNQKKKKKNLRVILLVSCRSILV